MLARQLHHHPAWTAADLAADLAAARDRLELMAAENVSVAAAFDLSYRDLTAAQQRLFRRLGLHPGTDIDVHGAAALDDTDLAIARRHLEALYDQYLLAEPARGRYRFHDLIREHARALAANDPPADYDAALTRLVDYYLHTARAANRHIAGRSPTAEVPVVPPVQARELHTWEDAIAWMDAERLNLHAAAIHAATHDLPRQAAAIPTAMSRFLVTHGHWDQAFTLHSIALNAARHISDQHAEADALTDLAVVQRLTADYPAAIASLTQAIALYDAVGDRLGEANALTHLGAAQRLPGNYSAATDSLTQALELCRALGDRLGEADALNRLGEVEHLTGNYPAAVASEEQALHLYRSLGNRPGQAAALRDLAVVQYLTGDYPAAATSQQQALDLYRSLGSRLGEAQALSRLGAVQKAAGDHPAAAISLSHALELERELGDRLAEAETLNTMAELSLETAAPAEARARHEQALMIAIAITALPEQARALEGIGRSHLHEAQLRQAATHLRQALAIYQQISSPDVPRVWKTLSNYGI